LLHGFHFRKDISYIVGIIEKDKCSLLQYEKLKISNTYSFNQNQTH